MNMDRTVFRILALFVGIAVVASLLRNERLRVGEIPHEVLIEDVPYESMELGEKKVSKERWSEEIALREFEMTVDPALGEVPKWRLMDALKYMQGLQRRRNVQTRGAIGGITWVERGPNNVSGRTRAVLVDYGDNTGNTLIVGGVAGGLWRTTNALDPQPTWTPINDFMDNLAIGSIAQDTTNPNIIYVGTGEGWFNADAVRGLGIWKSTDGGLTFNQLPSTNNGNFYYNQKIVVTASGTVLVATRTGVHRSTDGGNTWTNVLSGSIGRAADIEIAQNGDIYASLGIFNVDGIYKSTDDGQTWTKLTGGGIVDGRRIELACAQNNPNRILALFQRFNGNDCSHILRSDDGGATWTSLPVPSALGMSNFTRNQAWYDLIAAFHPDDDNRIFIGGIDMLSSKDSGDSWYQVTQWYGGGGFQYMHADQHTFVFDPFNSNIMYVGNDGGVYRTMNSADSIPTFDTIFVGYNVTQFYSCDINPNMGSNNLLGGTQDNGTQKFDMPGLENTEEVTGGDGGYCHIDQDNPDFQISSYVYNQYRYTPDNWNTIFFLNINVSGRFINPTDYDSDNNNLYCANSVSDYLRVLDIGGANTVQTVSIAAFPSYVVSAVTVSPNVANRVYFGFPTGEIFRVDDAHATPTATALTTPTFGYVNCIEVEEGNENHLLVAYSNYGVNSVWESTDGGMNWTSVEGNLPDMPIRWVKFLPGASDSAIVATELGVWTTDNLDGTNTVWGPTNTGLANVRVDMLATRTNDKTIIAATHGRGMFAAQLPTCAITASGLMNVQCNDNGTPCDPSDDYITFELNVQGNNTGATYTVSAAGHVVTALSSPNNYGVVEQFRLEDGSAGGGNVTITITDDSDPMCTLDDVLTDPGTCSNTVNAAARINEFHYDNTGADVGEFIEVYIPDPQPADLASYTVELYNGSNGLVYNSQTIDNFTATSGGGGVFYVWEPSSIQNGAPDGFALSGPCGVIEFLSYEGTFTANNGNAVGLTSTDVGVAENSSTPVGSAIQLIGGTWVYTANCNTKGAPNASCTCSISASGLTNVQCNDNGTPNDATDDYITFDLQVTGSNTGATYTVTSPLYTVTALTPPVNYNTVESFSLPAGSAGGGNVPIVITDDTDPACTYNDTILDPGVCSGTFIAIKDPCQCKNNATTLTNGQFDETVTVTAPSATPYTVPAAMTETPIGGGLSEYTIDGIVIDGILWTVTCTNGTDTLSISNQCYYPNPMIAGVPDTLCQTDAPIVPTLTYDRGDGNPPTVPADAETFLIDGIVITPPQIDPSMLSPGLHVLTYEVDAGDEGVVPPPGPNFPGCIQAVYDTIYVQAPPMIICPPDSINTTDCNITVPPAATMFNTDTAGAGFVNPDWPTILHGCGNVTLSSFNDTVDMGCTRTITIYYVATDEKGNADTCGQMWMFTFDTTAPTFVNPPADTVVECQAPPVPDMMVSDNCGCDMVMTEIWINEFHYDNTGTDVGEFIEVAGPAGVDLTPYSLVLYNGSNGLVYNTMNLTGMIDDEGSGFGAVRFNYPTNGIQNGAPDGIALVKNGTTVLEFISYEGTFTANDGPAAGMTSVDVGVSENSGTPVGFSLQRTGMGSTGTDFMWTGPSDDSPGDINQMQHIMAASARSCSLTLTADTLPGNCPNTYTIVRMWELVDACGNVAQHTQQISVIDTTPPEFCAVGGLPTDTTISCTRPLPDTAQVSAWDACDTTFRGNVWINEFHYDNVGADVGEFFEIAGYQGTDLTGYAVVLYNGSTGLMYDSIPLSGVLPAEKCGYGALSFDVATMQNGSPDGLALIHGNTVLEFLSYEGTFTAVNGPAAGMMSTNIGVFEPSNTPVGQSLQRVGVAANGSGFMWTGPQPQSRDALNDGQDVLGPVPVNFTESEMPGACLGERTITRMWTTVDACGNADTLIQVIHVIDTVPPDAVCKDTVVYLDENGMGSIVPADVDGGSMDSCSPVSLAIDRDRFSCADIGVVNVTLTVTDSCGNSSTCIAEVMVLDTLPPNITAHDWTVAAQAGFCEVFIPNVLLNVFVDDNCDLDPQVVQVDNGAPIAPGYFPVGKHTIVVQATDRYGNVSVDSFMLTVKEVPDPLVEMACNDRIQLSVDTLCEVTVGADMILEGGPYMCYDDYIIEVRDQEGNLIDDDPAEEGVQISGAHVGACYQVTVIDPETGNRCWGELCLEDKVPPHILQCPDDTIFCYDNPLPDIEGGDALSPVVFEGCGLKSTKYVDWVDPGTCALGYEQIIQRTWTFEDLSGNVSMCTQNIVVLYGSIDSIEAPGNWDGRDNPMLSCDAAFSAQLDAKINAGQAGNPHFPGFPLCVDDYLLAPTPATPHPIPSTTAPIGITYCQGVESAGAPTPM